jgi:hypothetical protein
MALVIWQDTDGDGDPGTGAQFLYDQTVTVQYNDNVTWNIYTLASPVQLNGPGDVLVGVVNRSGASGVLDYPASIDTDASQQRSWVGIYSAGNPPEPPTLPADAGWGTIDSMGFAGNWTLRASGFTGGADVPWLSESPITGTVGADSFFDVSVTFNSMTYTVGTYTATLKVKTDDPMTPTINVPVAMYVVAPVYGVAISGNMSQTARPGAVVTYTISVTNTSNGPADTYNMTLGTHTWTTTIDKATIGPLAQGASVQVKVTVHIPAGAAGGAFDAVQVTATSQHDPTKHATTTLTTTVNMMKIYLPIITKNFHS